MRRSRRSRAGSGDVRYGSGSRRAGRTCCPGRNARPADRWLSQTLRQGARSAAPSDCIPVADADTRHPAPGISAQTSNYGDGRGGPRRHMDHRANGGYLRGSASSIAVVHASIARRRAAQPAYLYIVTVLGSTRSCRRQGHPGWPWQLASPSVAHAARGPSPMTAQGVNESPGRDAWMPPGLEERAPEWRVAGDCGRSRAGGRMSARDHPAGPDAGRRPGPRNVMAGQPVRYRQPACRRVRLPGTFLPCLTSR
jgi:hypothetical protein